MANYSHLPLLLSPHRHSDLLIAKAIANLYAGKMGSVSLSTSPAASMRAARVSISIYIRLASIALIRVSVVGVAILRFRRKQSRLRHGLMARGF